MKANPSLSTVLNETPVRSFTWL